MQFLNWNSAVSAKNHRPDAISEMKLIGFR